MKPNPAPKQEGAVPAAAPTLREKLEVLVKEWEGDHESVAQTRDTYRAQGQLANECHYRGLAHAYARCADQLRSLLESEGND